MNQNLKAITPNVYLLDQNFFMPQLNRNRRIWVYLPSSYHQTQERYGVLYMQDGQNLFQTHTSAFGDWGIDKTLTKLENKGNKNIIVVGIDNGGEHRANEYAPWNRPKLGGGEGLHYSQFVAHTLKNYIDEHFRTKPEREHTGIGGSSMGGLISFYAGLKYPEIFSQLAILSPSFWFNRQIFEWVKEHPKRYETTICMIGSRTESYAMERDMTNMYWTLRNIGYRPDELAFQVRNKGKHNERFWAKEFSYIYQTLFKENMRAKTADKLPIIYG
jgi:predicted alpha/beta superfamily hydrolase